MEKFKYRLTWCSQKDTPSLRAAVEHMKDFPLFKDSKAQLISHKEYLELVEKKEIDPPVSYWQIKEGQVGLISLTHYKQYTRTWDMIATAKQDFCSGWAAHEDFRNKA